MKTTGFSAVALILCLLFSMALAAQEHTLELSPPNPTTETDITIYATVPCTNAALVSVTRVGSTIKIHFPQSGVCEPPRDEVYPVSIGRLPAGEYAAELMFGDLDAIFAHTRFIVVDAHTPRPFDIRPFAVPTMGGLPLRIAPSPCDGPDCSSVSVVIGSVMLSGSQLRPDGDGALWVTAPPHEPGLVDVTVFSGDAGSLVSGALYFYEPGATPDLSVFERVLFPVLFDARGAGGSLWRSEAVIANPGPWFVENWNAIEQIVCIDYPCGERLPPGTQQAVTGGRFQHGVYLLVPRREAERLSFSLRVRDVSREAESFGTEIPVLRESDMFPAQTAMTLLDVPLDPRYRSKLRIYATPRASASVARQTRVTTVDPGTGVRISRRVELVERCSGAACTTPAYAEINLPPDGQGRRVNIYVTADATAVSPGVAWAFVTITNNETQQVTIVTPDGQGGEPCVPCTIP